MSNEFRAAARACIFNKNNELLIVKMGRYWGIPGGGIYYGESVSDCIMRESIEELGIGAIHDKVLFLQDYIGNVRGTQMHCLEYFCSIKNNGEFESVESSYTNATHSDELTDVKFCHLDNLPEDFMPKGLDTVLQKYVLNKDNFSCEYLTGL